MVHGRFNHSFFTKVSPSPGKKLVGKLGKTMLSTMTRLSFMASMLGIAFATPLLHEQNQIEDRVTENTSGKNSVPSRKLGYTPFQGPFSDSSTKMDEAGTNENLIGDADFVFWERREESITNYPI